MVIRGGLPSGARVCHVFTRGFEPYSARKLNITPAYYVFRHFSHYIAVGATRIATSGTNDAVAFKNPDGTVIVEVYNSASSVKTMTVGVGSALSESARPGAGFTATYGGFYYMVFDARRALASCC